MLPENICANPVCSREAKWEETTEVAGEEENLKTCRKHVDPTNDCERL